MTTYTGHATENSYIKNTTLKDADTNNTFVLDSTHIYITAFDKNGKKLWSTDPWKDNKISPYKVKRPVIIYFNFEKDNNGKEVISIAYNNSQFGVIDKKTGKFTYYGQD